MPLIGELLKLSYQLFDASTTKFCTVTLRDEDDVLLAGTPVALIHIGTGLYTNNDFVMPDTEVVTATYLAFNDALFTIPSPIHGAGLESFRRQEASQEVLDCLEEIKATLASLQGQTGVFPAALKGLIRTSVLRGSVTQPSLKGKIQSTVLKGTVTSVVELDGTADTETLTGKI